MPSTHAPLSLERTVLTALPIFPLPRASISASMHIPILSSKVMSSYAPSSQTSRSFLPKAPTRHLVNRAKSSSLSIGATPLPAVAVGAADPAGE